MHLEAFVCAFLIGAHQPRITGHIGGKDGGEATGRGHGSAGPLFQGSVRLTVQPFAHHDMPLRAVRHVGDIVTLPSGFPVPGWRLSDRLTHRRGFTEGRRARHCQHA